MTQPNVQQSIFLSLWILRRVSGALHSLRPVPPLIVFVSSSNLTATLKSITLTWIEFNYLWFNEVESELF